MKKAYIIMALSAFPVLFVTFQNFTPVVPKAEKFKIIWHVGSAIEDMADASAGRIKLLNSIKGHVDGYYFLVLNNGSLLTYWPSRPQECLINYKSLKWKNQDSDDGVIKLRIDGKLYGEEHKEKCAAELEKYQADLYRLSDKKLSYKEFQISLHENALKRVMKNLDIQGEQAAGKKVMAEMLLRGGDTGDFFYNPKADKIKLKLNKDGQLSLPKSYEFLKENGIIADRLMTYQEPRPQSENASLLQIPLEPNGPTDYEPGHGGCSFCLPWNIRVIDLVADAFKKENLNVPRMAVNIRTWNDDFEKIVLKHLRTNPSKFDGINVEGSAKKLDKVSYDRSIEGAAWMLKNTNKPVSFLIPGYLAEDELDSQDVRDEKYLEHFLEYVTSVNEDLSSALKLPKGQNAICNEKLSLIVGSYGAPLHLEPLPVFRHDGAGNKTHRAGTVTSKILALSKFRDRVCQ